MRTLFKRSLWLLAAVALLAFNVVGCGDDTTDGLPCTTDEDCPSGMWCLDAICVTIDTDGGDGGKPDGTTVGDRDPRPDAQEDAQKADGPVDPDIVVIQNEDVEEQDDAPIIPDDAEQEDIEQIGEDVQSDLPVGTTDGGDVPIIGDGGDDVGDDATDGPLGLEVVEGDGPPGGDADVEECTEPEVEIVRGPARVYANMVEMAIPDGDGTDAMSTILVDEMDVISDMQVMLRVEHINVMDLTVTLESLSGTQVILHNMTANEYGDVMDIHSWYDDEGPRAKSAEPLANFNNEDIQGVWTLTLNDATPGSLPCDCDQNPDCDDQCDCDPECGIFGRLIQWELEFGPPTPQEIGDPPEFHDPLFVWDGLCADQFWWDSDAMPDTAGPSGAELQDMWNGNHELNVLHTFFVIGGDGSAFSIPASRTFQFTDVW